MTNRISPPFREGTALAVSVARMARRGRRFAYNAPDHNYATADRATEKGPDKDQHHKSNRDRRDGPKEAPHGSEIESRRVRKSNWLGSRIIAQLGDPGGTAVRARIGDAGIALDCPARFGAGRAWLRVVRGQWVSQSLMRPTGLSG